MPEKDKKAPEVIQQAEGPRLSDSQKRVVDYVANASLTNLDTKMKDQVQEWEKLQGEIDAINFQEKCDTPAKVHTFEAFNGEVTYLFARLFNGGIKPETLRDPKSLRNIPDTQLDGHLRIILKKLQELQSLGKKSPVYNLVFENWGSQFTAMDQQKTALIALYENKSWWTKIPDALKSGNLIQNALIGGGIYLAWTLLRPKITGDETKPFSIWGMFGTMLVGGLFGQVTGTMKEIPGLSFLTDWMKKLSFKKETRPTATPDSKKEKLDINAKAPLETREQQLNQVYTEAARRLFGSSMEKFPNTVDPKEFKKLILSIVTVEVGGQNYHPRTTNKHSALGMGQMLLSSIPGYIANAKTDSYGYGIHPSFDASPHRVDINEPRDPGIYDGSFGTRPGGTGYYINMSPVDQLQIIMYNHLGLVQKYAADRYKNKGYDPYQLAAMAWFSGEGGVEKLLRNGVATKDAFGTTSDTYAQLTKKYMNYFEKLA